MLAETVLLKRQCMSQMSRTIWTTMGTMSSYPAYRIIARDSARSADTHCPTPATWKRSEVSKLPKQDSLQSNPRTSTGRGKFMITNCKQNRGMPPILSLTEPDFWGRVRRCGAFVQPFHVDLDIRVHCVLAKAEISLGEAARRQAETLICHDCAHRRPCGRAFLARHLGQEWFLVTTPVGSTWQLMLVKRGSFA